MKEQLCLFRSKLEEFALQHKADIRRDPVFRAQFHTMCANIGVDPLASNKARDAAALRFARVCVCTDACVHARAHVLAAELALSDATRNGGNLAVALQGMWNELLGFGDFYYELGVQLLEACLASRPLNGGLMELSQVGRPGGSKRLVDSVLMQSRLVVLRLLRFRQPAPATAERCGCHAATRARACFLSAAVVHASRALASA